MAVLLELHGEMVDLGRLGHTTASQEPEQRRDAEEGESAHDVGTL